MSQSGIPIISDYAEGINSVMKKGLQGVPSLLHSLRSPLTTGTYLKPFGVKAGEGFLGKASAFVDQGVNAFPDMVEGAFGPGNKIADAGAPPPIPTLDTAAAAKQAKSEQQRQGRGSTLFGGQTLLTGSSSSQSSAVTLLGA